MTLKDLLVLHEGVKLKPYFDSVNKLTIGVGRNLDDNGISGREADIMLENDISRCNAQLIAEFPWFSRLGEVRQAVIIDMCFNMGINGLLKFKNTLKFIEDGRYDEASVEMLNSQWANQVGERAKRLSKMMKLSQWPEY